MLVFQFHFFAGGQCGDEFFDVSRAVRLDFETRELDASEGAAESIFHQIAELSAGEGVGSQFVGKRQGFSGVEHSHLTFRKRSADAAKMAAADDHVLHAAVSVASEGVFVGSGDECAEFCLQVILVAAVDECLGQRGEMFREWKSADGGVEKQGIRDLLQTAGTG